MASVRRLTMRSGLKTDFYTTYNIFRNFSGTGFAGLSLICVMPLFSDSSPGEEAGLDGIIPSISR